MAAAIPTIDEYQVGLITAIVTEYTVACAILDEFHDPPDDVPIEDSNTYTFGKIGRHYVVVACLPQGRYGLVSATSVAENLRRSFTSLKFGLMVGIGGGAPSREHDIRLGDVVVGIPTVGHPGVVQYNYGKEIQGKKFQRTGSLNEPPRFLLTASSQLRSRHDLRGHRIDQEVEVIIQKYDSLHEKYSRPEPHTDILYKSSYEHPENAKLCDEICVHQDHQKVDRKQRNASKQKTVVHYGLIASADSVMKNALVRDDLAETEGVLCFEMEAAGLVNSFPCIVIRGICDYSDTHKNKQWQGYAAAAAAVYARELLLAVRAVTPAAAKNALLKKLGHPQSDSDVSDSLSSKNSLARDSLSCLQSLGFEGMETRFRNVHQASDGTCVWIKSNPMYQRWISQDHGLLWIKGKPGAGKSVLLKSILGDIESVEGIKPVIASFFVHGRGTPLQKSGIGLYRSLLQQILSQIKPLLLDFTARVFVKNRDEKGELGKAWNWDESQLFEYLHTKVRNYAKERRIKIFIDALDECGEETARQIARDLSRLAKAPTDSAVAFSICFACRHFPVMNLHGGMEITVETQNSQDISRYAENELLDEFPDPDQRNLLVTDILLQSSGLFLWVVLIIPRILDLSQKGNNINVIRKTIQDTTNELWLVYEKSLAQLPSRDKVQSLRLIQWVCLAESPLSLSSLRFALSYDSEAHHNSLLDWTSSDNFLQDDEQMRKRVNTFSGGLLEVVELTDLVVQFIHQTVKDYFMSEGMLKLAQSVTEISRPETLSMVIGSAHKFISRCCVRYIHTTEIRHLSETSWTKLRHQFPFLEYAVTQWHTHAKYAENHGVSVEELLVDLEWPSRESLRQWITLYSEHPASLVRNRFPELGTSSSILHVAAHYGLNTVIRAALEIQGPEHLEARDSKGYTPLLTAVRRGQVATLKVLIELGARHDVIDNRGDSPLYWATFDGRPITARTLLDNSADPNKTNRSGETPLICASKRGNIALVDLLLKRGALPNYALDHKSALWWAAFYWHGDIVERLILNGADPDININGLSLLERATCFANWHQIGLIAKSKSKPLDETTFPLILSQAIQTNRPDVVRTIIEKGANPNARNKEGLTPLEEAIRYKQPAVAEILISKGAILGFEHEELIHVTARPGPVSLMSLLMERFNPDVVDSSGLTPLCNAIVAGNREMIDLLVLKGAKVNTTGRNRRTPLSLAVGLDDRETVDLILQQKIDVDVADARSRTPIHYAALQNNHVITEKLLAAHASLDLRDIGGSTALLLAVKKNAVNVVHLLLQYGATAEIENYKLETPLMWSTMLPSTKILLMLLDSRPGFEKRDNQGRTALFWAVQVGNIDIINILLRNGVDISVENSEGLAPLHWAAKSGRKDVVSKLLEKDTEIDRRDQKGFSPLWHAVLNRNFGIALLLIRKGASLNTKDSADQTLLQYASINGYIHSVEFLCSNHVDIDASRTTNWNLLVWAAETGNRRLIEMIIDNRMNLRWSDTDKIKAFFQAVIYARSEVVELFIHKGIVQVDCQNSTGFRAYTALGLAVTKNLVAMVETLLRLGADVRRLDFQKRTPISYACEFNQEKILKLLIRSAKGEWNIPDIQGRTPLWWAVAHSSESIVALLLEQGKVDPKIFTGSGNSLLTMAVQRGNVAKVEILLRFQAQHSLDAHDRVLSNSPALITTSIPSSLLDLAVENGDEAMVQLLLQYNAAHENVLKSGETLMTWAVKRGNLDIVKTLIQTGHPIDQTALEWAMYNGHQEVVRFLIENG